MLNLVWSKRLVVLVLGLLIGVVLVTATGLAEPPSPDGGVTPDPFPFSDRYPAEVILESPGAMTVLLRLEIDVGNVRPLDATQPFPGPGVPFRPLLATVYINDAEAGRLEQEGLVPRVIPNESLIAHRQYGPGAPGPDAWPSFEEFVARMQGIATSYPDLVRMISIGQSVQGREIWMLKISDNPDVEEDEPEFKYTSTMHGDEVVGVELVVRLAELLTSQYGVDPDLTMLVDGMEIWLCPIHNPDGYVAGTRYNAHGEDLNRDFPDRITDPYDDPTGREPETQAFMYFGYDHRFVMGTNYHGGAAVVNYPWDSVPNPPDFAPDDALFYEYSAGYAIRNPRIYNGGFPGGVTRGWEWYIIRGGMQDWAYHWRGEHHVTIELGNTKTPPYSQMDTYWDENRDAMLWWMERSLMGVRGLAYDGLTGDPLDATVDVVQIGKTVRTDPDVGDYHRLLLPGTYTVTCTAEGYLDQAWEVEVVSGTATVQDCAMLFDISYAVVASDSEAAGEPGDTVTHTFAITNAGTVSDTYDLTLTTGAWPAVLLDSQIGPLEPLEGGQVQVTVDIPALLVPQSVLASDVLTLHVTSVTQPPTGTLALGTTHAVADLDLLLAVDQASQRALAGEAVTYTLTVTNNGAYTDTYNLSLAGNAWPSQVMPAETPPLAPGEVTSAQVRVEIPADPGSVTDVVTVQATSSWDVDVYAQLGLLTRAVTGLSVALNADAEERIALAGQVVSYTLVVSNTGAYTDTYTLSLADDEWPTTMAPTQTQLLGPGTAAGILVRVEIPVSGGAQEDAMTVRATSGWDSQVYAEQSLVTHRGWRVYLPLVRR